MNDRTRWTALLLLGVALFTAQTELSPAWATLLVTDPDDVGNDINTLGVSMSEEVGNTSLATFNNLALQRTFTMDSAAHTTPPYPAGEVNNDSFVLTAGGSGVDKTLNMSRDGNGFWSLAGFGAGLSSGDQTIVRGSSGSLTSTFTFDTAVQAFGFTLNRFNPGSLTVNLYSDSGRSTLIDSFVMSENSSTGHSFFGYTSAAPDILLIDLVATGVTQQFGIDDVSFSNNNVIPEPSTLGLLGMLVGGLLAVRRTRR